MTTFTVRSSLGFPNENVQAFNISQDGTANTAANPITVPAGKFWILKNASVTQSDATARAVAIQVVDASDNVVLNLAGDIVTTGATSTVTRFSGHCVVPAGYKVRGLTTAISASTPTLQVSGLEASTGLPSSAFGIQ